jgi:ABC-type transporter Mla subunit MlaD
MKEKSNEKIILTISIFIVILLVIFTGTTIYNNNNTIRKLENTIAENRTREQKSIEYVRQVKNELDTINRRYTVLTENNRKSETTIRQQRDIIVEIEGNNQQLRKDKSQLADTINRLSARLSEGFSNFDDFRKGLERQRDYNTELSKTITEIETNGAIKE